MISEKGIMYKNMFGSHIRIRKMKLSLALVAMIASMSSCGKSDSSEIANNTEKTDAESVESRDYTIKINGSVIHINQDADEVISKLGEPVSTYESPFCGIEGKDILYSYDHFEMDVYEAEGKKEVYDIIFKDDLITTGEGGYIGDSIDHIVQIYGEGDKKTDNSVEYEGETMKLVFIYKDNVVTSIQYISTIKGL